MEKHAVARLIGSPPGYVGFEEGGQLTEIVRHRPYSLILFDEIEKAHPDVFNILLQILDAGRLTDGKGKMVNFKNSIIIMTSNVGSHYLKEMSVLGFGGAVADELKHQEAIFKDRVREALRERFKPEFLNRIDEVIIFNSLRAEAIEKIVGIQLAKVEKKLAEKNIRLALDPTVRKFIARDGFDPEYGARPIKRLIQKAILDKLAEKIIGGQIKDGDKVKIDFKNTGIRISV